MSLARVALALCVFVLSFTTAPLAALAAMHRSSQVETTQQSGRDHLPHARATSHASEHAFAGEVTQPQAISSPTDATLTSIASPRIARVGASPEETGLSATRFRMWEAETGRWLSPDPLGVLGGLNLLGFDGCPALDTDPLGLATVVSCQMRKKILEGEIKPGTARQIRGGHSGRIVNNKSPKFAVETLSTNPNGTREVKFVKELPGGIVSKSKTSTLFPESWSSRKIIAAVQQVGEKPGSPPRPSDGTTFHKGVIDGVEIEVLKIGDNVTSAYPTGN